MTVVVKDAHGRYEPEPVHVEVENVVGTASITVVRAFKPHGHLLDMYVGSELNFILDWSDAGFGEPEGWEINWGDGNVELIEGNPQFVTHVYEIAGLYASVARLIGTGISYRKVMHNYEPRPNMSNVYEWIQLKSAAPETFLNHAFTWQAYWSDWNIVTDWAKIK